MGECLGKDLQDPQDYLDSIQDGRTLCADGEKITNVVNRPITRKGALAQKMMTLHGYDFEKAAEKVRWLARIEE